MAIMRLRSKLLLPLLILVTTSLLADDGAASVAAGGLIVMSSEPRITMAKEVLRISPRKVIVNYDFRNDSDRDITTEVAFPIPDYSLAMSDANPAREGFDDFRLWVNDVPARFRISARAYLDGKDYTDLLRSRHIDVVSFGHSTDYYNSEEIEGLTATQLKQLEQIGLVDKKYKQAKWTVKKKYYWLQTFPAHKTVHISHVYSPFLGGESTIQGALGKSPDADAVNELKTFCLDTKLQKILQKIADSTDEDSSYTYVDFILTTANTWKKPIEDFTLIVDGPHGNNAVANYVSFCWDGPIVKTGTNQFTAHAVDFVPKKELRIGFFNIRHQRH